MNGSWRVWIGPTLLFAVLIGGVGYYKLFWEPAYQGDPAAISRNEALAQKRVADLVRGTWPSEIAANGYRFRRFGSGADARGYAWPEVYGITGVRAYAADGAGHVAWTNDPHYEGTGNGPPPEAAFTPGESTLGRRRRGADGNDWRLLDP